MLPFAALSPVTPSTPLTPAPKKKRHVFTVAEKVELAANHVESGRSFMDTARMTGLSKSTIRTIVDDYLDGKFEGIESSKSKSVSHCLI